jgi:uncharacterized membrane protein
MESLDHLWAVGYDDPARAGEVLGRLKEIWADHFLIAADAVVVVRRPDGTFHFEREGGSPLANVLGCGLLGALVGLVVLQPLAGAAIGAAVGAAGSAAAGRGGGIGDDFIADVTALMRPGTSALFLLARATDEGVVLHQVRGLGGTVLKTNVDPHWAEQVRRDLAGTPPPPPK